MTCPRFGSSFANIDLSLESEAEMANRDVVVIGGSTGSMKPLRAILHALPAELPAAVAVVMHIPSRSTGVFSSVTAAAGVLPVEPVEDGIRIQHGRVYLAVPDHHLIIEDGRFRLGSGPRENLVRPAIDPLFRSAAAAYGPRVIGVVLSGKLNDGADGLRAIKRCGGMALVQSPHDSAASEMPLAALQATSVDLSSEADGLGPAILRFVQEQASRPMPVPPDILLEIQIALGRRIDSERTRELGSPVPITCPGCGGVLTQVDASKPLRFRCQVGHGFTARALAEEKEASVDEAIRVALRIVEERAELVSRMGREASEAGRNNMSDMYFSRAAEYRGYADTLRVAVLERMAGEPMDDSEGLGRSQVIGQSDEPG